MPDIVRTARPIKGLFGLMVACCAMTMVGCAAWFGREPAQQNEIVKYYNRLATEVAKLDPKIQSDIPSPTIGNERELTPPQADNRWSLSLAECIRLGLQNSSIIRQNAQFMSPNNPVMRNPDGTPSVYDSLIQNKGVLFGSRGTDAALSDFDPKFSVTMKNGNDVTVDNLSPSAVPTQVPANNLLENNYMQMQSKLEQQLLGGGTVTFTQNWSYALSNQPDQLFNSAYTGVLGAEYRQPLWAGSGRTYTSVAGPIGQRARGFSNVSQGIVIAHINKRLSEIDLQENLQNLVREIGDLYWDLYQNYQDYDAERAMAEVAEKLWKAINSRRALESGVEVAQAEAAYYEAKAKEEAALSKLYLTETQLRRLMSLSLDDNRLIYPSDVPREDELRLNRPMCLYEALVNRVELTRQKTNLHSLQLQLCAAKKLVAPRFDFVSGYALNGFGHNFIGANSVPFSSAVGNLYSGRETSWNAGFEYSIPLWLRQEKAQVSQLEFKIVKAKKTLEAQESEIAFELYTVLTRISNAHKQSKTSLLRLRATRRQVDAARSQAEALKNSDAYLKAQMSLTQAKLAYSRNVTEYNKYLRDLLFRMGRLLPADGVSVLGADGLPVLSPANPEAPFEDLLRPFDPNAPIPDESRPPEPDQPGENDEEKPWPKPKKIPSVAEGDDNAVSPAAYLLQSDPTDTEFSMPHAVSDELSENELPETEERLMAPAIEPSE